MPVIVWDLWYHSEPGRGRRFPARNSIDADITTISKNNGAVSNQAAERPAFVRRIDIDWGGRRRREYFVFEGERIRLLVKMEGFHLSCGFNAIHSVVAYPYKGLWRYVCSSIPAFQRGVSKRRRQRAIVSIHRHSPYLYFDYMGRFGFKTRINDRIERTQRHFYVLGT